MLSQRGLLDAVIACKTIEVRLLEPFCRWLGCVILRHVLASAQPSGRSVNCTLRGALPATRDARTERMRRINYTVPPRPNLPGTPDRPAGHSLAQIAEQQETTKNGHSRLKNQIAWTRFYLAKGGCIEPSERGIWQLTKRGETGGKSFIRLTADSSTNIDS
ncbi:MAG: hypothetical protein EA400_05065 [Chromatiaceae bacterium]|nr:MAG: hypothetical protein EA400_05065 [Chromatiaceae bacterium]